MHLFAKDFSFLPQDLSFLQWVCSYCFFFVWLLRRWPPLFTKVKRDLQTLTGATGWRDYVRLSACAPRQRQRTSQFPAVLSGRYLRHLGCGRHLYRWQVSQTLLSTSWNKLNRHKIIYGIDFVTKPQLVPISNLLKTGFFFKVLSYHYFSCI